MATWADFNKTYSAKTKPVVKAAPVVNTPVVAAPVVAAAQPAGQKPAPVKTAKPVAVSPSAKVWADFNLRFSDKAYEQESVSQNDVDPSLFKRLKIQKLQSSVITNELKPEKTTYFDSVKETLKSISPFAILESAQSAVRGVSQVAATPIAGAAAAIAPKVFGVTPKEAMRESLRMAADNFTQKVDSSHAIDVAGQRYLESRQIGKYGGKEAGVADVAALAALKFFDLFGDPVTGIAAVKSVGTAAKEFATFKKVGQVTQELAEGSTFVKGTTRNLEIPISNDLKIKIKPKESSIVIEGYKRRFGTETPKQGLPGAASVDEATSAAKPKTTGATKTSGFNQETEEFINSFKEVTGNEVSARYVGNDLVLQPGKQISAPKTTMLLDSPKLPVSKDGTLTLGNGFTMTNKVNKEAVALSKATATYQEQLRSYNTAPTPTKLKRVLSAKTAMELLQPGGQEAQAAVEATSPFQAIAQQKNVAAIDSAQSIDITPPTIQSNNPIAAAPAAEGKAPLPTEPIQTNQPPKAEKTIEPEMKQSRLGKRLEEDFIEKGLVKEFTDLPEYKTVNVKEQAKLAADLIEENFSLARDIALGKAVPEGKLLTTSMYIAMKNYALKANDVDLGVELARAHTVEQASYYGQQIRMLREASSNDPVKLINKVEDARKAKSTPGADKRHKEFMSAEQKKIQQEIKKVKKTEADLQDFINSIKC